MRWRELYITSFRAFAWHSLASCLYIYSCARLANRTKSCQGGRVSASCKYREKCTAMAREDKELGNQEKKSADMGRRAVLIAAGPATGHHATRLPCSPPAWCSRHAAIYRGRECKVSLSWNLVASAALMPLLGSQAHRNHIECVMRS